MEQTYGWTGKLLRVDLTRKTTSIEEWDHSWIGGKAFGVWALFREEPVDCEDFDPGRILIFSSGPLTGTIAPASSRANISNRHILNGGVSTSSIGGFFPSEMKYAGYDHILITGKAKSPVYLYINNEDVKILDGLQLWGKDTWETESALIKQHSDPDLRVACIGPAGENLVRLACIIGERNRAASWGGNGALMGSKNLKAIAIRGTRPINIANPSKFLASVKEMEKRIGRLIATKLLRRGGTVGLISPELNPLATKNYRDEYWDHAKVEGVTHKVFKEKHKASPVGCFNCSIACGRFLTINEGQYSGIRMDGVQLNALRGFASNLDITATDQIIKANAMVNKYGLGVDGISSVVSWVLDCVEKKIITEEDIGYRVDWGKIDSFIKLTEDIVYKQGIGKILGEGIKRASEVIGRGSENLAILVKGAEVNEGRMRTNRAWALGIMTSPRSGGHLDGAPAMEGVGFDDKLCQAVYGIPNANDTTSYEHKAKFVIFTERLKMLVDSLGLCWFTSVWGDPNALTAEDYTRLYSEATGDDKSADDLINISERALNVEKAFNTLHANFTRKDDYPSPRLLKEEVKSGPFKGTSIQRNMWNKMLDEYYELHGWDKSTGLQTAAKLSELELKEVASRLARKKRLIG